MSSLCEGACAGPEEWRKRLPLGKGKNSAGPHGPLGGSPLPRCSGSLHTRSDHWTISQSISVTWLVRSSPFSVRPGSRVTTLQAPRRGKLDSRVRGREFTAEDKRRRWSHRGPPGHPREDPVRVPSCSCSDHAHQLSSLEQVRSPLWPSDFSSIRCEDKGEVHIWL